MLQSSMWSQLARVKCYFLLGGKRMISYAKEVGPMSTLINSAHEEVEALKWHGNHWMCKGKRTIAVAVALLQKNEIIAVPTDTIYGLACLVSSTSAIEKLYEIKEREVDKPLSICVGNLKDIQTWGIVDHVPISLLSWLLPGPYTIILKRTPALNPALNPNHDTVGIRVPHHKFIRHVAEVAGPLALTSANISNEPSCVHALEFENLWNKLGGIFHQSKKPGKKHNYLRRGSTIIDLTEPGRYRIIRHGIGANYAVNILKKMQYISN
ncbi:yrdC domain-containing protein, mitochondrial-like isoform X1 [Bombus bifarius]|uniref:Threonylcarbamoyl-AMP synthase n=1 Tax=Bombus bifarius TaxID=103933 RepID=A0A6P8N9U4_9HYME|nr:yrdC domain-containing protein, mitochondrial-like isoform X1 [Bombus bifarius]XP_033317832.1 yrdC domain-containing protein, mitochondrial-like isoform X1 [Bombus bifarius]XP_033317838.1 yrdC domain-containing protein, mitochondrial-like isoform X1 [Bombus bifarius]